MTRHPQLGSYKLIMVDCNFLIEWAKPSSEDNKARLDFVLNAASEHKQKIVVGMPAVAEYLVRTDVAGLEWLEKLQRRAGVQLAPFDLKAAYECAQLDRAALGAGDKKDGSEEPWQKIKVDRQLIGIAKATSCTAVVSGDDSVRANALRVGMKAFRIDELELPMSAKQVPLPLADPNKPAE